MVYARQVSADSSESGIGINKHGITTVNMLDPAVNLRDPLGAWLKVVGIVAVIDRHTLDRLAHDNSFKFGGYLLLTL